jgi:TIR domain-containing protein
MPARRRRVEVFISHASCDEWVAKQIARRIEQFKVATFVSELHIRLGDEDFEDRLLEALEQCSELIVLLTPEALQRPYVWMELGAVWVTHKRASVILYRLTVEDLRKRSGVPLFILKSELIDINRDTEHFLEQLQARFRSSRTRR